MTKSPDSESREPDEFLSQVKTTLDMAAEEIDGVTQTRLRAMRREALAAGESPNRFSWFVPAGGLVAVATITVLTLSLWVVSPDKDVFTLPGIPPLEDIALLSDKEDPEFYEELDFYLWLDSGQLNSEQLKGEKSGNEQQTG